MSPRTLTLERPLVAIDLETTGLDAAKDRIIEICCVKLFADGSREVRTRRLNPAMPISAEATAVHGIRNEDVAAEPLFEAVAKSLAAYLAGCDLTGFNIEHFDLPLLVREFKRAGMTYPEGPVRVIDSRRIFLTKEPRDLAGAVRFYCGKQLERAHSAEADAIAAAEVLLAQVARYDDLPLSPNELHEFCHPQHPDWLDPDGRLLWQGDKAVLGFGKHKGRSLEAMAAESPDYLRWMAAADFSAEVAGVVKAALRGEFPVKSETEADPPAA
jgi:DNA polymerase III subunit epsilon